jgi:hypothetical protein
LAKKESALATVNEQFSEPLWRLSNLYYIVDKMGRECKFVPNEQQYDFLTSIHGKDIILKARQLGFTTLAAIVSLDECLWTTNWSAAIIAHTRPDAQKILKTKVRFPYDKLPDGLKNEMPLVSDAADTLALANGSSVVVTSSARGGTLQRLHVSEFGKICARFPDKAEEIISGSFPAAENGHITIESTAEGQQGQFFDMTQRALGKKDAGDALNSMDFKVHFYPWWENQGYRQSPELVRITDADKKYFDNLEYNDGIKLDDWQRAWWVMQEQVQGGTMKREYPATPGEAFEQALEGAYFEQQLAHANKRNGIGAFPFDPRHEVNTFWDLGRNDATAIWLHQDINGRDRFIKYYENSGEEISHYLIWLRDWLKDIGGSWGSHYWPHDGDRQDLFLENGRLAVVDAMGFRPEIVSRVPHKMMAIEAARAAFPNCDFHHEGCSEGIKRLKHYRKEWDARRGVWKDKPLHDDNSNGADAFMTFAQGVTRVKDDWGTALVRGIGGIV